MRDLSGKVVVVTGGAGGLGLAIARAFGACNARLVLCDIDPEALAAAVDTLPDARGWVVDVSDREAVNTFADQVMAEHGRVDVVVNNAGVTAAPKPLLNTSPELVEWILKVNLWGTYNVSCAFLPHLLAQPEAALVNIGSAAGLQAVYGYGAYCMSKFAVRGLSETLQMELRGTGVTVTSVHPGGVRTDLMDHARGFDSDSDKAAAVHRFITAPLLSPDTAARKILRAVRRKRYKLVLGLDARVMGFIRWLLPASYPRVLGPILKRAVIVEAPPESD
ncbi:MAG: SDR family oxidoreductase [Deltaproteobacteria bacterium]|nr:SDR family oxidoreductase [Deltaproteobacteria bacterium]